jgi:hypothetical protein
VELRVCEDVLLRETEGLGKLSHTLSDVMVLEHVDEVVDFLDETLILI